MTITNNKFNGNVKELLHVQNPESAYILGFLWADGFVNKNKCQLKINESDFNQIKNYFHHLGKFFFKYSERRQPTWQDMGEASLFDSIFARNLIELGYGEKSYISPAKILKVIPRRMHSLFWRGYFDGDGSIILSKEHLGATIKFGSTIEQDWSGLEVLMESLGIFSYRIERSINKKGHKNSAFILRKRDEVLKLFYFLYKKNTGICLNRKYVKWISFISDVKKSNKNNKFMRKDIKNSTETVLKKIKKDFSPIS